MQRKTIRCRQKSSCKGRTSNLCLTVLFIVRAADALMLLSFFPAVALLLVSLKLQNPHVNYPLKLTKTISLPMGSKVPCVRWFCVAPRFPGGVKNREAHTVVARRTATNHCETLHKSGETQTHETPPFGSLAVLKFCHCYLVLFRQLEVRCYIGWRTLCLVQVFFLTSLAASGL